MVHYRRNRVAGGTYFFTVTLADRRSRVLVDHIDVLRAVLRRVRAARPFGIVALVVLPVRAGRFRAPYGLLEN